MASGTAFADRYKYDPFLRTQINVIGMLVLFSVIILSLVGVLIDYLYQDIALSIVDSIRDSILAGGQSETITLPALEEIRTDNFSAIAFITAATTIAFGYLLTRVALAPTRSALSAQKQFIGNIAHELRTPLSVIKTNTEVALLGTVSTEAKAMHESNIEELDRLSQIINNLLSLSASVRPERIEFTTVDIAAVATDVVQKLENLASIRNLDITMRKGYSCFVWGNVSALEQIISNVVKNAINYTGRGGHVSVTVEEIGNSHVEVVVQDSGTGISRQDLFRIFEPFYRADASRTKSRGGTGLGLAIVSELVKLHRGKITVRSAIGRGTTVVISLPSAKSPETDQSIRNRRTLDEVAVDFSHRRM